MRFFVLLILVLFVPLCCMELQEGDILIAKIYSVNEGQLGEPYSNYGMVCQDQQLIWDDSIYAFEIEDSVLTLWPYTGKVRLVDGKLDRRNLKERGRNTLKSMPIDTSKDDIHIRWETFRGTGENNYRRYRGYWQFPGGELRSCFLVDSLMLSNQLGSGMKAVITSISDSGLLKLQFTKDGTFFDSYEVNLYQQGYLHLTPTNLNRYLNTASPFESTPSVDSLLRLGELLKVGRPEVALQILQHFTTNNYFVIRDGRAMEILAVYLECAKEECLQELKKYWSIFDDLKSLCEWQGLSADIKVLAKQLGYHKNVLRKCRFETQLLLYHIERSSRRETAEQKRLFELLVAAIIAYN